MFLKLLKNKVRQLHANPSPRYGLYENRGLLPSLFQTSSIGAPLAPMTSQNGGLDDRQCSEIKREREMAKSKTFVPPGRRKKRLKTDHIR